MSASTLHTPRDARHLGTFSRWVLSFAAVLAAGTILLGGGWIRPQPLAWLWIGSQADYWLGSHMGGIVVAFVGILASLFVTLSICSRLDRLWRMVRRAAGHEQREGALARIFGASAVIALIVFGFWFLVIQGPAPSLSAGG